MTCVYLHKRFLRAIRSLELAPTKFSIIMVRWYMALQIMRFIQAMLFIQVKI